MMTDKGFEASVLFLSSLIVPLTFRGIRAKGNGFCRTLTLTTKRKIRFYFTTKACCRINVVA